MPFATRNGVRLFWRSEGSPANRVLMLLHAIGTDMSVWDRLVPDLLPAFRILRMDIRGHGASDVTQGDYTLAMLADDAFAVLDAAGVSRSAVAGLSLGGMIAMEMALRTPERVEGLGLLCTSAEIGQQIWSARIEQVRAGGMESVADVAMTRFLSASFRRSNPVVTESLRMALIGMSCDGYTGAAAAIRNMRLNDRIGSIAAPTLVVTGERDSATPFEPHGAALVGAIPHAKSERIECGHLASVEAPATVAALLRAFFLDRPDTQQAATTLFEAGLDNRRRILGDAWVDKSLAARTPFTADFQELITRTVWQEIWGRPGLDDRTRRLLVLAITATQGRWEEFRLHVRSGLENDGFLISELKETLLQLAVYAGVPAANTAFAEAAKIVNQSEEAGCHSQQAALSEIA